MSLKWMKEDGTFTPMNFAVETETETGDGPLPSAITLLTADGIRTAALERLRAMEATVNAAHRDHNDGVLRGLIWALTGNDPGTSLTADTARVLDLLGIPHQRIEDRVEYTWPPEQP